MKNESIPLDTSNSPLNPTELLKHEERVQQFEKLAPPRSPVSPDQAHELNSSAIGPLLLQEYMAQKGISSRARETFETLIQRMRQEISANPRMADKLASITFDDGFTTQLLSNFESALKSSKLNQADSDSKEQFHKMYALLEDTMTNVINQKSQERLDQAA